MDDVPKKVTKLQFYNLLYACVRACVRVRVCVRDNVVNVYIMTVLYKPQLADVPSNTCNTN